MNATTVGLVISGISVIIAAYSIVAPRRRKLDETALESAKRQLADDDARRSLERITQDNLRSEALRKELGELSEISARRFKQWQDSIADLDELWVFLEDEMLPWARDAYSDLRKRGSSIRPPPHLPRREHKATDETP